MLALPISELNLSKEGIITSTFMLRRKNKEPAGRHYQKLLKERNGKFEKKIEPVEKIDDEKIDKEKLEQKRRKRSFKIFGEESYYDILDLPSRSLVTEKIIKKKYKRLVIRYHPDKYAQGDYNEKEKEKWLNIQTAYDTLMDETKRRRYDSTLEFNDEIPKKSDLEKNSFFDVFTGYFDLNSYFSVQKNVPKLGDEKMELKEVMKFYDFWFKFESWRQFSHKEEHIISEAENRNEKRWMEKENKKMKSEMIKKESKRIKKMVSMAYEYDPRILKMIKEQEDEKQKKKDLQKLRKQKKKEEIQRKIREEKEAVQKKKEEALKIEKEKKEAKKKLKEEKENFRKEFDILFYEKINEKRFDKYYVNNIFEMLKEKELNFVKEALKNNKINSGQEFDKLYKKILKKRKEALEKKKADEKKLKEEEEKKRHQRVWPKEDLSLLHKGLLKYPPGTNQRWVRISNYLKNKYTEQEICEKVTEQKSGQANNKRKTEKKTKWTQEEQKLLEKGIRLVHKKLKPLERWNKIAKYVPGKSTKECVERFKFIKSQLKK